MVVYSTSKKLRVQRKGKIICFINGAYFYNQNEQQILFAILSTVSPKESIITNQYNEQINKEKPIFTVKKSTKTKAKKVKGDKDAN